MPDEKRPQDEQDMVQPNAASGSVPKVTTQKGTRGLSRFQEEKRQMLQRQTNVDVIDVKQCAALAQALGQTADEIYRRNRE